MPTDGLLFLTTHRLVYRAVGPRYFPSWLFPRAFVEVDLNDIVAVNRRSWFRGLYGGYPGLPVFRVDLVDGRTLSFQTFGIGHWQDHITAMVQKPNRSPLEEA